MNNRETKGWQDVHQHRSPLRTPSYTLHQPVSKPPPDPTHLSSQKVSQGTMWRQRGAREKEYLKCKQASSSEKAERAADPALEGSSAAPAFPLGARGGVPPGPARTSMEQSPWPQGTDPNTFCGGIIYMKLAHYKLHPCSLV